MRRKVVSTNMNDVLMTSVLSSAVVVGTKKPSKEREKKHQERQVVVD